MSALFDYVVHDAGWAAFTWRAGPEPVVWDASCLHHSLQDLADLALHLQAGASQAHAAFWQKPGECWLHLQAAPADPGLLHYQLRAYASHPGWGADPERHQLLQHSSVRRSGVIDTVCRLLDARYRSPGPAAYQAMQRLPFPARQHLQLCGHKRPSPVYGKTLANH